MAESKQIRIKDSAEFPHVKWIELKPGKLTECAILKEDQYGNLFYFEIPKLDNTDKRRLFKLLTNRHAKSMELWDLMSNHTLGNGMNALTYFHQLVKVVTPDGVITDPRMGVITQASGTVTLPEEAPAAAPEAPAAE